MSFSSLLSFQLAKEAYACEEKEEKLVSEAVTQLTDANLRLSKLTRDHHVKTEECNRQKEEITRLLAQVRFSRLYNIWELGWQL